MVNTAVEISQANQTSHENITNPNLDVQYVETQEIDMDETILVYDTVHKSPTAGDVQNTRTNDFWLTQYN